MANDALQTFVGPRILIKFAGAWEQAQAYEYMTAVYDTGFQSWISKCDVPANTPLVEGDYWMRWSDPNAQFQLLQQTVQTFDQKITDNTANIATNAQAITTETEARENAITSLTENINATRGNSSLFAGKNVMFVTDSWGVNNANNNGVTNAYPYQVCDKLHANLIPSMISGTGFVNTSGGKTYLQRLTDYSEKESIAAIFIQCSINDAITSKASLLSAMNSTIQYAISNYPNANVYIIPCVRSQTPQTFNSANNSKINNPWYGINDVLKSVTQPVGILWNVEKCLQAVQFNCMADDTIHENQSGANMIANAIVAAVLGNYSPTQEVSGGVLIDGETTNYSGYGYKNGTLNINFSVTNKTISNNMLKVTFNKPVILDPGYTYGTANQSSLACLLSLNNLGNSKIIPAYAFLNEEIGSFSIEIYVNVESPITGQIQLVIF